MPDADAKPVRLRLSRAEIPNESCLARIRTAFDYNPITGLLIWKSVLPHGQAKAGDVAGTRDRYGYIIVTLKRRHYRVHQIGWYLHNAIWPTQDIDHIDGCTSNNAIENLRLVTATQNGFNRRMPKTNTSGVKGVYWNKQKCKWQAQLTIDGRVKNLGRFSSRSDAEKAVKTAREINHGEYARHD